MHVRSHAASVTKTRAHEETPEQPKPEEPKEESKVQVVEEPEDAPTPTSWPARCRRARCTARTGFGAHRYAYIGGAVVLATGLVFAYYAQGEAKRAETVGSAQETASALSNARGASAAANVMYLAASALVAYALLVEVLPQKLADRVSLTFHF